MASAFVYGQKTLNDNWYEDRHQPPGSLTGSGDPSKRNVRKYESEIAYIGERYDVLTRISRVPQKPSYATPHDGFNEKARTSSVDFAHPRSRKDFVAKPPEKPKFITTETVPEVCHEERRPLPGNARGFGAVLNRHEENHDQRHWNTSTGDSFGYGVGSRRNIMRREPSEIPHGSGVSTEHEEGRSQGLRVGILCGEEYRDRGEPASDTRTQRSWLYTHDASLRNIHHGGSRPNLPKFDNELSVPIGEGAMAKVRADLKERQGRLFRTATQITKGRDKRPGIAIFKDDP
jgi:hypothetical protein